MNNSSTSRIVSSLNFSALAAGYIERLTQKRLFEFHLGRRRRRGFCCPAADSTRTHSSVYSISNSFFFFR